MRGLFILGTAFVILCACVGTAARDNVLLPTMVVAYPGVAEAAAFGINADETLSDEAKATLNEQVEFLGTLLREKNREELTTVDWPELMRYSLAAVAAWETEGRVGPGVADSLRERILKFDEAYRKAVIR